MTDVVIRRAGARDLEAIVAIKRRLALGPEPHRGTQRGGFLLGSDLEGYRTLLQVARIWILCLDHEPAGFAVTLADEALRASPVWARRELVTWDPDFDVEPALEGPLAYFDQLAVLPGLRPRYWGAALALVAMNDLLLPAHTHPHAHVLTTTVVEPMVNRAALPYLRRVGAREVGSIREHYPEVGWVRSALHLIAAQPYIAHIAELRADPRPGRRRLMTLAVPKP